MNSFAQSLNTANLFRLGVLALIGVGAMAFFFYVITRVTSADMTLLYGDLSIDDSTQIIKKLEANGIRYQIGGNGSQIFVPDDRVQKLRMTMAEAGLPSGGSVGYEIFDRSGGMGSSTFVQNINRLRALEGELERTIRTLSPVLSARVHLVLPKRELFTRKKQDPTASITLRIKGGNRLSGSQVMAVRYLVAAAVPGLVPDKVAVIDSRGRLLARSGSDERGFAVANTQEMRQAFESRLSREIETLLERSLGPGTVRAQVTADIDFSRLTTTQEVYDPDGQVVRSTQTVAQSKDRKDGKEEKSVSVAQQLPRLGQKPTANPKETRSEAAKRTEETVNYEISKTVRRQVRDGGNIRRLSVAVVVDGTYGAAAKNGTRPYTPRTPEQMKQITALVDSVIGFDAKRGDKVEVANMQFKKPEMRSQDDSSGPLLDLTKSDYFRIGEILILLLTAVMGILFVVRPLVKRLLDWKPTQLGGVAEITDQSAPALTASDTAGDTESEASAAINIDQIEGKVKASSLNKIGEIVQNHPDESVSILRNWMFNES